MSENFDSENNYLKPEAINKHINYKYIIQFLKLAFNIDNNQLSQPSDMINTKTIYNILIECDKDYFYNKLNLTFDQSFGILYTELKEIITLAIEYIENSGIELNYEFKYLKNMNVSFLLKMDQDQIFYYIDLIILVILNCINKEVYIDKLLNLSEDIQQEVLNIIEIYVLVDETRDSIKNNIHNSVKKESSMNKFSNNSNNFNDYNNNNINEIAYINELKEENSKLKQEASEMKLFIEAHEDNIKDLEKKIVSLTIEINSLKNDNFQLKKKNDSLANLSNVDLQTKVLELEDLINQKIKEIENMRKLVNDNNERYHYDTQKLNDNVDILKHKLAISENEKQKMDVYDAKLKENQDLKNKIDYYENLINSEGYALTVNKQKNYEKILQEKKDFIEELELKNADLRDRLKFFEKNYTRTADNNVNKDLNNQSYYNLDNQTMVDKEELINDTSIKSFKKENAYSAYIHNKLNLNSSNNKKNDNNDDNYFINNNTTTKKYYNEFISDKKDVADFTNNIQILEDNNEEDRAWKIEEVMKECEILKQNYIAKNNESDYLKKELSEKREMYEREIELMTSCIYNLGVQFLNVKHDYSQRMNENPPWLTKERLKFFNGDL